MEVPVKNRMRIFGQLVLACVILASFQECLRAGPTPIVFVPRDIPAARERHRMLGRAFIGVANSSTRTAARYSTMRDALGAPVVRIAIHHYPAAWGGFAVVAEYITRLLDAAAEGELQPGPNWAEGKTTEVFGTIEFRGGVRRPLEAAKGYVCFQDVSSGNWCGRYLGPNRERWIVPQNASHK